MRRLSNPFHRPGRSVHVMLVPVLKPQAVIGRRLHDRVVLGDVVRMSQYQLAIFAPDGFLECPRACGDTTPGGRIGGRAGGANRGLAGEPFHVKQSRTKTRNFPRARGETECIINADNLSR